VLIFRAEDAVDLLPDEAQQTIVDTAAAFLSQEMPLSRLRRTEAATALPSSRQWTKLAELGWFGLGLGEDEGGAGFSLAEEALLFREVGRRLGSVAIAATALAARVAGRAGDAALRDALAGGRRRAAWAEPLDGARIRPDAAGRFLVFDGEGADVLVAANGEGAVLLAPQAGRSLPCLDETTRPLADVGSEERLAERAAVLAAAMLCGVAEEARDQAARYARERVQFGKPIGVFQAVKHRCADMAVRCEAAWSQTAYAALALRDGHADAPLQVAAARVVALEAALENASRNVQVHGGYGFTTEFDAHLLVKRAHVLERMAGASRTHLATVLTAERER
jgi:alkylation response protein AidB-like acyl-CoA dehydrogenase